MRLTGRVTPPSDMVEAARKSLSTTGFDNLMRLTGGKPPTPKELCAAVDQERAHDNRAERNAS